MPFYNGKLNQRAKDLRKNMTPQEKQLWYQFLQKHPMKFYKQKIVGNYILYFYCHSERLAIELDGSYHYEDDQREYDDIRTKFFKSQDIEVIRFSNSDVDNHFTSVCKKINIILNTKNNKKFE